MRSFVAFALSPRPPTPLDSP